MRNGLVILLLSATAAAAPTKQRVRIELLNDPIFVGRERHDIAAAIGQFLVRNGFEVVPAAELERLSRIAREGRSLKNDEVCGVPVAPRHLFEHELGDAKRASASVTCLEKTCELVVEVEDGKRWHVAIPARPKPAQVVAAIKRLKPEQSPGEDEGVMGGTLGSHVGVVLTLEQEGAWIGKADDAIETQRAAIDACVTDVRRSNIGNAIVLDITGTGSVRTCESQQPDELPAPGFDCLCSAFAKIDFGKASGTRRLRAEVWHQVGEVAHAGDKIASASVDSLRSSDPTAAWAWPGVSPHALATCIPADLAVPKTWAAGLAVTWRVDAHGHATKTTVAIPGALPEVKRCVETALATATFACPQAGGDVDVSGVLSIGVYNH